MSVVRVPLSGVIRSSFRNGGPPLHNLRSIRDLQRGRCVGSNSAQSSQILDDASVISSKVLWGFKIVAMGSVVAVAYHVLPAVDAMSVPHAVQLVHAKDGLLVRSGARRISSAVRRRPERVDDFVAAGAVEALSKSAVRPHFSENDEAIVIDSKDVASTRDVIFDALAVFSTSEKAWDMIQKNESLLDVVNAAAVESETARRFRDILSQKKQ